MSGKVQDELQVVTNTSKNSRKPVPNEAGGITLNQAAVVKKIAKRMGKSNAETKLFFDTACDIFSEELILGNDIKIHGKGRYYISQRSERTGRNPSTGEEHIIPAREAIAFQTSAAYAKHFRLIRAKMKRELSQK